ncbi:LysR family transcriptional regulator [Thiopseudomonas denitrificans]|uniref:DNA-binding transcriptional LysR family regulator n=1 Tax=Thiopseudomonas denitrificans TaxID=1501432 RepID=A0A4R6U6I6_9GAMM|nr:LysR family transcriptional regulator [Thiopseudomonas denitrificans]TDQ40145.1 DNA-binding transcriptional LysR family regulator [Thiopseudomonas denitrificans]
MDLANLQTFIAIAEHGSFSLAGETLHITQPAVSKRLAALEEQLGARLFDRLGRETRLTQAGEALLPRAYRIVNELEDSKRVLQNLERTVSGRLRLATSHHIGLHRLPPVLRHYTRAFPEVVLDIRFLDSEVAYNDVVHGRCELALITLSPQEMSSILSVPVWHDELVFVAAPEHPLSRQKSMQLQDLCNWPAVFPGSQTFTSRIILELFSQAALTPNIHMHTNYLETIKMMVSIGLAWSVLPRSMVDHEVVELQVPGVKLGRDLGYILHPERTLSNAAQAFINTLGNAASAGKS